MTVFLTVKLLGGSMKKTYLYDLGELSLNLREKSENFKWFGSGNKVTENLPSNSFKIDSIKCIEGKTSLYVIF